MAVTTKPDLDDKAAIARLLRFLSVPGITGQEAAIAAEVRAALIEAGVPADAIRFDDANQRIPLPTQTGNLIVQLPGTGVDGPHRLFMCHLDTVPLCAGAKPKRKGSTIVNTADTALGGDNRTGVAVLVTLAAELIRQSLPHPPITLLFTVREESGLFGAKFVDKSLLSGITEGYNFDGRLASDVIIGAVGAERWEVDIHGLASHAGVAPEHGISAIMIAAKAMAQVHEAGYWGKVKKIAGEGTSNIGVFAGKDGKSAGDATNVVTDYVHLKGESRSHDMEFVKLITNAYKDAFEKAVESLPNSRDEKAKLKFTVQRDYYPFRLKDNSRVVKHALAAMSRLGWTPNPRVANGGLDANWMVKHKIPVATFGAGQNEIHTVKEFVDLTQFQAGCELALVLATT